MIVTRGQVVAAWGDVSKTYHTHSTRKSFMSALYGIYSAEGRIDTSLTLGKLDIREKGTELTAQEKQATILDLLRARSGVYLPAAGEVEAMRDARPPRGSHAPGTFWYYNNWDFNVLGTVFRQLTGDDIFEALKTRIADPIGMQDFDIRQASYEFEPVSMHPGYWFRISARDFARFGHLYLRGGRWNDRQIVPKAWVEDSHPKLLDCRAEHDQGRIRPDVVGHHADGKRHSCRRFHCKRQRRSAPDGPPRDRHGCREPDEHRCRRPSPRKRGLGSAARHHSSGAASQVAQAFRLRAKRSGGLARSLGGGG